MHTGRIVIYYTDIQYIPNLYCRNAIEEQTPQAPFLPLSVRTRNIYHLLVHTCSVLCRFLVKQQHFYSIISIFSFCTLT